MDVWSHMWDTEVCVCAFVLLITAGGSFFGASRFRDLDISSVKGWRLHSGYTFDRRTSLLETGWTNHLIIYIDCIRSERLKYCPRPVWFLTIEAASRSVQITRRESNSLPRSDKDGRGVFIVTFTMAEPSFTLNLRLGLVEPGLCGFKCLFVKVKSWGFKMIEDQPWWRLGFFAA